MTAATDADVIVIGGGPAGLAAALALRDRGSDVLLVETEDDPGGNMRAVLHDGAILARGPQAFPRSATHAWWLVERAGLIGCVVAPSRGSARFVFRGGRLHRLPSGPGGLATTRLLSAHGKLRLLCEPFQRRGGHDLESVRSFFTRRIGRDAVDALVGPFVSGIHAGDPDTLEARSAFPTLVGWERSRGSLVAGAFAARRHGPESRPEGIPEASLYSIRGGLRELAAGCGRELGETFRTGSTVRDLERVGARWRVETDDSVLRCRHLVLAVPPPQAARLLARVSPVAAGLAAGIPMAPVAVVHLGGPLRLGEHSPDGFGALVARGEGLSILGIVFTSALFPDLVTGARWLQATYVGGALDPGIIDRDDEQLRALVADETRRILGFDGDRGLLRVIRHPAGIPQFVTGHADRVVALRREAARIGSLSLAGNWLEGIGLDAAIGSGRRAAQEAAA